MKTTYDCSALAEKLDGWATLETVKISMLEAIGNIAVAVSDKDANRVLEIQSDLMWVYEALDTIKERKEVEQ